MIHKVKLLLLVVAVVMTEEAAARPPRTTVWDTGRKYSGATSDLNNKNGWQLVTPESKEPGSFKGDVVLENSKLQVLFSAGCAGPLVYSRSDVDRECRRMSLVPLSVKQAPCGTLTSLRITENNGDQVTLEVTSRSTSGESARMTYSLSAARSFVKVTPVDNIAVLRVETRARFAVMPDFFGDDTVFDPRKVPGEKLYIPAENFLLGFTGAGNTLLMSVWPSGDQEVQAVMRGDKADRFFEALEFSLDKKSIYLAVLDAPGIWHSKTLEQTSFVDRDIATGWKKPFPARWRGDCRLAGRTDSFEFESQRTQRGIPPFGNVVWPFWFQRDEATIRLINKDYLGVAVIYPLERVGGTPLAVYTPVDMLRETLGAGPCEYILDREGIGTRNPGGSRTLVSTGVCNTTGVMHHIFEAGLEYREKKLVQDLADDVLAFNVTVRLRLEEYRTCARQMMELCRQANKNTPAIKLASDRVEALQKRLDQLFKEKLPAMKTPEQGAALVQKVKDLTREEDPENLGQYVVLGAQLRGLAGTQDSLANMFRAEVRLFRRELSVIPTSDSVSARFVEKLRDMSRQVLRKKHYTEGA
jgi:hypothetical protein